MKVSVAAVAETELDDTRLAVVLVVIVVLAVFLDGVLGLGRWFLPGRNSCGRGLVRCDAVVPVGNDDLLRAGAVRGAADVTSHGQEYEHRGSRGRYGEAGAKAQARPPAVEGAHGAGGHARFEPRAITP